MQTEYRLYVWFRSLVVHVVVWGREDEIFRCKLHSDILFCRLDLGRMTVWCDLNVCRLTENVVD